MHKSKMYKLTPKVKGPIKEGQRGSEVRVLDINNLEVSSSPFHSISHAARALNVTTE